MRSNLTYRRFCGANERGGAVFQSLLLIVGAVVMLALAAHRFSVRDFLDSIRGLRTDLLHSNQRGREVQPDSDSRARFGGRFSDDESDEGEVEEKSEQPSRTARVVRGQQEKVSASEQADLSKFIDSRLRPGAKGR